MAAFDTSGAFTTSISCLYHNCGRRLGDLASLTAAFWSVVLKAYGGFPRSRFELRLGFILDALSREQYLAEAGPTLIIHTPRLRRRTGGRGESRKKWEYAVAANTPRCSGWIYRNIYRLRLLVCLSCTQICFRNSTPKPAISQLNYSSAFEGRRSVDLSRRNNW